jgi:hypothetical protein
MSTEVFSYNKKEEDKYNENKIINIWNSIKPHKKITPTNKSDPYCRYDGEDQFGNKYEIKSINDPYQNGQHDNTLLPVAKVGCWGNLYVIYEFYDSIYYIRYSHHKFKNYKMIRINGARHFLIPKHELSFLKHNI